MYYDNQSAIALCLISVQHSRRAPSTFDIRTTYHRAVKGKLLKYFVFRGDKKPKLADIFTKALLRERFATLLPLLGVKQISPETLKELQDESVSECSIHTVIIDPHGIRDAPAKPPQIITTNTLSNIKLPVLQKDDYDTWAMEMEHYLEYIDNEVWKVIQNGNSKKRVTKGVMVIQCSPPTTQEEQFADEKERKADKLLLMLFQKTLRRFHDIE
ncbi:hypothetical protein Tco_1428198 [Tanacetum coccineum]